MTGTTLSSTSLRDHRKRRVRERLYGAAIQLFRLHGFEATTVESIVELAGTSKGTFFNHFPTKDHVLVAYHDRMTQWVLLQVQGMSFPTCEAAVTRCVEACAEWVENDHDLAAIVVRRVFGGPVMFGADQANTKRFMAWFANRVRDGVDSGELRPDLDQPTMLAMIAAVLSATMNAWALGVDEEDLRSLLRRRLSFVFDASRAI